MVKADRNAYKIFSVGDKGSVALSRPFPDLLENSITHIQTPLNFPTGIHNFNFSLLYCNSRFITLQRLW